MARWRLTQPHYLRVPGVEWEQEERTNDGEVMRHRTAVDKYLDPKDPRDQTPRGSGECYVYQGQKTGPGWAFTGEPTPDMEPMDEEAEAISAKLQEHWAKGPIESLPAQGGAYGDEVFRRLESLLSQVIAQNPLKPVGQVDPMVEQMMAQMMQMQETIQRLEAKIQEKDEPLPDAEPTPEEIEESEELAKQRDRPIEKIAIQPRRRAMA